jgi:hypothetical protein
MADYKNLNETLNIIGELIREQYKNDLKTNPKKYGNGRNSVASGKLFNSIDYKITFDDKNIKLFFVAEDYWINIEEGSKYTTKMPPIDAIRKWMVNRNISGKNLDWKIQRSIFSKGIRPKPYLRDIKQTLKNMYKDDLEKALKKDLKASLSKKVKEINNKNKTK